MAFAYVYIIFLNPKAKFASIYFTDLDIRVFQDEFLSVNEIGTLLIANFSKFYAYWDVIIKT